MPKFFHLTTQDASKILESINAEDIKNRELTTDSEINMPGVCCVFDLSGSSASIKENGSKAFIQKNKDLFSDMTNIIYQHGGIIEKFPGDGISFHFVESRFPESSIAAHAAISAIIEMDSFLRNKFHLDRSQYRFTVAYGEDTIMTFIGNENHLELITIGHGVNIAHKLEKEVKNQKCFIGIDYKCFRISSKTIKACWPDLDVEYFPLPTNLQDPQATILSQNLWHGFKY